MPHSDNFQIDTSKPVAVTGATGYVAGVLISQLFDAGLTVHATVRDPSKKDRLQYLQDLADSSERGSIKFFAADLLDEGSFDEACEGCSVIFHTASPFALTAKDPQRDLVDPAVKGTENVLNSAAKASSVTRVVVTSSIVAVYNHASDMETAPNGVLNESVWNRTSSLTDNPYNLSKTLAEQKAWVMAGSQTKYKLVVVNPGFVLGPGLKFHPSSESYQFMKMVSTLASSGAVDLPFGVVDVRDVAAGHIAAGFREEAQGRYILVSSNTKLIDIGKAIGEKYPPSEYPVPTFLLPLPKSLVWAMGPYVGMSRTYVRENVGYEFNFDSSKSKAELGMKYLPMETTMQDMYGQMLDFGVITPKKK